MRVLLPLTETRVFKFFHDIDLLPLSLIWIKYNILSYLEAKPTETTDKTIQNTVDKITESTEEYTTGLTHPGR